MVRIAINGFGRIGRMVFRAAMNHPHLDFVAVNDLTDTKTLAYLLKHDSVHEKLKAEIGHEDEHLIVNGKKIRVFAERDPANLPWKDLDIDIVVESTGFFNKKEGAQKHLDAGAKKCLISAPAKSDGFKTIVLGINEDTYDPSTHHLVSNASCTTNNLAPLLKVINDNYGIESGYFLTVHAYTGDQRHVDAPHRDLRRARACAVNIIPTTSGAAIAAAEAIPELRGKITGGAIRVPVPCGSCTQLTCTVGRDVTIEEVNTLFENVANHHLKGILEYSKEPLVSTDILDNPHSAVFDADQTLVLEGRNLRVMAWYDNEWGYSNRMVELLEYIGSKL